MIQAVTGDKLSEHWETTDWDDLFDERQVLFEKQWKYLWTASDFYREKLADAGLSEASCPSLLDLTDVPFTTKEEFRESAARQPPLGLHLAADPSHLRQIQTSSGTTGVPMAIGLTASDAADFSEVLRRGYVAVGYSSTDLIVHAFSMSRAWIGGLCMIEGYLALGATILPVGAEAGRDKLLDLMQQFHPSAISATPGFLLNLALRAQERGIDPAELGIRHMLTGGEPGGGIPSVRNELTSLWGAPVRETMGGTDVAPIVWGECAAQRGMHYLAADTVWFEIVDPHTGAPLPLEVGTVGEIVYTHLAREATPILRFRHRDLVEVTAMGECSCGRQTPQVRCIGRTDDMLIVRGVNLFPSAVRSVLSELPGFGPEFRIVRPAGVYTLPGPVRIKVEFDGRASLSAGASLSSGASLTAGELAGLLHERLSCAFEVELVPPDSLVLADAHKSRYFEDV